MKPLLVIDGKPRLYDMMIRSVDLERLTPEPGDNFVRRRVVPGSERTAVLTRDGYGYTLRNGQRCVRPSGRSMLSFTSSEGSE